MRPVPALLILATVTGCAGGTRTSPVPSLTITAPAPSPSPSPSTRPRPARPGAVCGHVTTITGGIAAVVVVRGRPACDEVMRILETYNDPTTPVEGIAGLVVIDHWTCETQRGVTTCVSERAVIRARP